MSLNSNLEHYLSKLDPKETILELEDPNSDNQPIIIKEVKKLLEHDKMGTLFNITLKQVEEKFEYKTYNPKSEDALVMLSKQINVLPNISHLEEHIPLKKVNGVEMTWRELALLAGKDDKKI